MIGIWVQSTGSLYTSGATQVRSADMHEPLLCFLVVGGEPGFCFLCNFEIIHQRENGGARAGYSNGQRPQAGQLDFGLVKSRYQGSPIRLSNVIYHGSRCKYGISGVQRIHKLGKLCTVPDGNLPGYFVRQNASRFPRQQFRARPANHCTPCPRPG